eukprot:11209228-Lingulodinium_polyedra.AAC.1
MLSTQASAGEFQAAFRWRGQWSFRALPAQPFRVRLQVSEAAELGGFRALGFGPEDDPSLAVCDASG